MSAAQFAQLREIFAEDLAARLAALRTAAAAGDAAWLAREAHQLRGSAANMGAIALAALATKCEEEAAASTITLARLGNLAAATQAALDALD